MLFLPNPDYMGGIINWIMSGLIFLNMVRLMIFYYIWCIFWHIISNELNWNWDWEELPFPF
ncbi:hypothetical protein MBGDF03_01264 [Thermoplasmatales archaeon SCGC AB-540-F20]|nr:hypothetical protein MBGDF03_01264 [Thermoplasmatales archaeon SCGC AB-540-F20]